MSASGAQAKKLSGDQKLLLGLIAAMLAVIVTIGILAPQPAAENPKPSTYNSAPRGTKAAFLTLQRLGYRASRWTRPLLNLTGLDATRTTLVLADPAYNPADRKEMAAEVKAFLDRGGRVLTTGAGGAELLPDSEIKAPSPMHENLCSTTPEGPGELARAGRVELEEDVQWASDAPVFRVEHRCGDDAVVVRYGVGQGEAIWWASATPMSNAELHQDADLRLLLASVGHDRDIVFNEAAAPARSLWDAARGLPLRWLGLQTALLLLLLVFSFSRRRGPIRMPVALPRSSPVEFAESMGDLYARGHATSAATDAARRRLLHFLRREAGLSQGDVQGPPEAIAETLHERLGGDWRLLAQHLHAVQAARDGVAPRSALALVRALNEDREAVRTKLQSNNADAGFKTRERTKESV